jgi:hypothetical protein
MTATTPDRNADMLAELAEMDLRAARHIHARLLAATEAAEVADLSRSYQRASRCVRQTLALKAKLAQGEVRGAPSAAAEPLFDDAMSRRLHGFAADDRMMELQDAMDRVIHAEHVDDEPRREALMTRFDRELDDWAEAPDFLIRDLDTQVLHAARALDLSEDLARVWRTLPKPPRIEDDLDWGDDDVGEVPLGDAPPVADTA